MTKDNAIALFEGKFWVEMTYRERAEFQLFEPLLCMPFDVFHEAVEHSLGRSVFTHEFGLDIEGLRKELLGERHAPSQEEILNMIPAEKRVLIIL